MLPSNSPLLPTPIPTAPPIVFPGDNQPQLLSTPFTIQPGNLEAVEALNATRFHQDPEITVLVNAVSPTQLQTYVTSLTSFGTRHVFSATDPQDYGIGAARNWIFSEFVRLSQGSQMNVSFDDFIFNYSNSTSTQRNIVATLPGVSQHAGVIVMMAHYDSRSVNPNDGGSPAPGANDNASGVAAMLEVARLMSTRTWNQTIVFIAFAAEEQGRYGSIHYVQNALLDGQQIDAALNNDIIGGRPGIANSIRIFAAPSDTADSRQLARYMQLVGNLYLPDLHITIQNSIDRPDRYSDHISFIEGGYPAIRLTEAEENFNAQHNSFDTADKLDYNYLAEIVRLNLATISNLAGAPPRPLPPTITPMANPGSYLLVWGPDPRAASYAISLRPLGSNQYYPTTFHYVSNMIAGNIALTDLDPNQQYALSLAALDANGRLSAFSRESPQTLIGPPP